MASRVAKNPVKVPAGVQVNLAGQDLTIKGKHGELKYSVHPAVRIAVDKDMIQVQVADLNNPADHQAGSTRALVNNMVKGVSEGFQTKLVLVGVGYRAKTQGNVLNLSVGFSHPVDITMPPGITVETPSATEVVVKGSNKQLVTQVAANIRAVRPIEPYKGKGIRYENEKFTLKEVKKK